MTIEVGHEGMLMGNHITGSVFYNDVDDYVTTHRVADAAMGQELIKMLMQLYMDMKLQHIA
jgi:hypothetical protein